jgi:plastocyanin
MSDWRRFAHSLARIGAVGLASMALVSVVGCTQALSEGAVNTSRPGQMSGVTSATVKPGSMPGSATVDPDAQTCADCAGKGMAPMVDGAVKMMDGVQVVAIGVKDGYYDPNQFTAQTGTPITVVFTGKARGCLGNPQFKSLGKKADFTKTGSATIELGSLPAGTYGFACGMGMTGGKLVVE